MLPDWRPNLNWLWVTSLALLAVSGGVVILFAPVEQSLGPNQKILYVHLPVAVNTLPAAGVLFLASIGYLLQQRMVWDDLAVAAGKVTLLLCTVVLVTGVILSKSVWGQWWLWSPRLIFSLVLWGLYAAYFLLRIMIRSPERRAAVCSVFGLAAFLDVPLVYLSLNLMPDIHPAELLLTPSMRIVLAIMMVPVTMLTVCLVVEIFRARQRFKARSIDPMTSPPIAGIHV